MRNTFRPWAIPAILLLAAGTACAQPAPRPRPGPAAAAPGAPDTAGAATAVASGTVQRLLVNPGGDLDGLLLDDGTQVSFPPQSARDSPLRTGERVAVTGWRTPVARLVRASGIANGDGKPVLAAVPPSGRRMPKPPAANGEAAPLFAMNTSGAVARLLHNDRGDVDGALLDNGTVVRFPPHAGTALGASLQTGRTVYARGWGSRTAAGNAIEANAIGTTADTMQDVLAGPGKGRPRPADGPRGRMPPTPPTPPAGDAPASRLPPPMPAT